jgi:hypothetical protein
MSRSRRKPYTGNVTGSKYWKQTFNNIIRHSIDDVVDGAFYRRVNDIWHTPLENRGGMWDVPKMRRK